ncbi:MAG: gluconate:H+ symporter [Pseudomonadota bacterium]
MIDVLLAARPLAAALVGVVVLLSLILRFRMNAFPALLITALLSAILGGLGVQETFEVIKQGVGGTLGFIAVVIGLGALYGAILEATGGLQALAAWLSASGRPGSMPWWFAALGLIAAIPVFFDVALIIFAPLIFSVARQIKRPAMALGLPLIAGLAAAHAFIPPTPGPIAVAELLGAELGLVIAFGLIAAIPAVAVGGPIYAAWLERRQLLGQTQQQETTPAPEVAKDGVASRVLLLILLPLVLILLGAVWPRLFGDGMVTDVVALVGHPFVALLVACGATLAALRPRTSEARERVHAAIQRSLEPTGTVILVTGAGGAFKQVLVETGGGQQLADMVLGVGFTPLLAAYVIAVLVRITQGSATVAMITAAGLTAPITEAAGLGAAHLALVVIAIAAGATTTAHVNDSGFWLVSRLFALTEKETLRLWTVSTTLISVTGLLVVLLLYAIV